MTETPVNCANCGANLTSYDPGVEYGIRDQFSNPWCSIDCQFEFAKAHPTMKMSEVHTWSSS